MPAVGFFRVGCRRAPTPGEPEYFPPIAENPKPKGAPMNTLTKIIVVAGFCLWVVGVPFESVVGLLSGVAQLAHAQVTALRPAENFKAFAKQIQQKDGAINARR